MGLGGYGTRVAEAMRTCTRAKLVGVISGTGLPGMRLTYRMPIFVSGMAYPDCFVADTSMLAKGYGGVLAAGYFGPDWSVDAGDFAWRKQ